MDHAAPANVNRAILFRLLGDSWDAPEVAIQIAANWDREIKIDLSAGTRYTPDQYPAWGEVAATQLLWIEDVQKNPAVSAKSRELYSSIGVVSLVTVPLVASGKPIGSLVLHSSQPWPRTDRESRIYAALADQAAISIENRNLLGQSERRARQLQTSAQIAQAATSILDLDELFNQTVNLILDGFAFDHVQIFLITPDGTDARLVASTGDPGKQLLANKNHLEVASQSVLVRFQRPATP